MKMKKIIVASLALLSLAGCGNKITEGEVVDKSFTPAHNEVMMIPITQSNGKTFYTTVVPFIYHYSDNYQITIEKWDEDENKNNQATYRVEKEVYNSVSVGDEFSYEKDMTPNTPEYTREKQ